MQNNLKIEQKIKFFGEENIWHIKCIKKAEKY